MTAKLASPAEIVQKILVEDGLAVMPGVGQRRFTGPPQVFSKTLTNDVDYAVSVTDGTGYVFARSMRTNYHDRHCGLNLRVRAPEPDSDGYNLTKRIFDALLAAVPRQVGRTVTLFGTDHHVSTIYHVGDFTRVGEETETKRFEWMWRSRLVFDSLETTLAES